MANSGPFDSNTHASSLPRMLHLGGILVRELEAEGYRGEELLHGSGRTREEFLSVGADLSWPAMLVVSRNALRLTGNPALGLWFGRRVKLASMGVLGLAALSSLTIHEAVMLFARYATLHVPHVKIEVEYVPSESGNGLTPTLRVDEVLAFDGLRVFLMEGVMRFIADVAVVVVGKALQGLRFEVTYDEPAHWSAADFEYPVRFGMPEHRVYADNVFAPLVNGSKAIVQAMVPLLEQEMQLRTAAQSSSGRARAALARVYRAQVQDLPTADEMARLLDTTPRTFRRQLADEGTHYRALIDEFRREKAEEALAGSAATVSDVALHLGYRDAANFRRAFRRWTGCTPNEFREAHVRTPGAPDATSS